MEASQFDRLTKSLTEAGTRRRLLGALATVPVLGGLAEAIDAAAAKAGKGKRSRRRRDEHDVEHEKRKKGGKKRKKGGKKGKKGGPGTTAPPSTTLPPRNGETCDDLAFAACFAPRLNQWDAQVGGCTEECDAGANAACEQCLNTAVTDLVEPFTQCFVHACDGASRSTRGRNANRHALAAAAVCNPLALSRCSTSWLVGWVAADLVAAAALGVPGLLSAIATDLGSTVLDTCQQQYGCPKGQECHVGASGSVGVCCVACHRYDPGSQTCVASCAADEACNAFGQCRKTCKQCYDYLVNGRQMPCGQITNNCGAVLNCNGCASTERCQNRRCVPQTCVPGRGTSAADECCLPQTCEDLGKDCGEWADGCGGVLDCGPSCGCVRATCEPNVPTCNLDDGCGGKLNCCPPDMICNTTRNDWAECCKPLECGEPSTQNCLYDHCLEACRACPGATIAGCTDGDPSAFCPLRNGWQQEQ